MKLILLTLALMLSACSADKIERFKETDDYANCAYERGAEFCINQFLKGEL